jgi:hypothetical protein
MLLLKDTWRSTPSLMHFRLKLLYMVLNVKVLVNLSKCTLNSLFTPPGSFAACGGTKLRGNANLHKNN